MFGCMDTCNINILMWHSVGVVCFHYQRAKGHLPNNLGIGCKAAFFLAMFTQASEMGQCHCAAVM